MSVLSEIQKIGIVPVIKIEDASQAVPLAQALIRGGIPVAEVTFRTAAAAQAIAAIHEAKLPILLGAGTVLTLAQVDEAEKAGASFIVSPGLNPTIVKACIEKGIPVLPGCSSPSDIERALDLGLDTVKFFPAEQAGGLPYIKAVAGPYTQLKFIPTGGIGPDNLLSYLAFPKILACGGSWMIKDALLAKGDYDGITVLCKQAVNKMLGYRLDHIGVHTGQAGKAQQMANLLENLFGFPAVGAGGRFSATHCVEFLDEPFLGEHGHIGITTYDVERAMLRLSAAGMTFREETIKRDAKGYAINGYLTQEICGFAIHVTKRDYDS